MSDEDTTERTATVRTFQGNQRVVIVGEAGDQRRVRFANGKERTLHHSRVTEPKAKAVTLEQAIERHGLVPASSLEHLRERVEAIHTAHPPRPLRAVPKPPKPLRCKAYLAYVRKHPCCLCGRTQGIEAHHHGPHGAGQKTDDYRAAPLCDECHRAEFHQHGCLPGMTRAETDAFLYAQERELLLGWLATRPDDDGSDIHLVIVDALVAHIRTKGAA